MSLRVSDRKDLTIYDVMICPECNSDNCYSFADDEIEFGMATDSYNGEGHCIKACHCKDCGKIFSLYFKFRYDITEFSRRD